MQNARGYTRYLLVVALTAAALLLATSVVLLLRSGGPGESDRDEPDDARMVPTGGVRGGRDRARVADEDDDEDDDDPDIYDWEVSEGSRKPFGDVFAVTPDSLRRVLADRHWEEIRRQIWRLQENGGEVPADVVTGLIALLQGEDTRLDAVLALGGITGDSAGRALAAHATDVTQPLEVRAAALDALATSGSRAALTIVQTLATEPDIDPALLRHACPALARIGGQDAARTLLGLLSQHRDTDLEGMLVQALGKTAGAGDVLAQSLRSAQGAADAEMTLLIVNVARLHGPEADAALRLEIRRLVEDPSALEFVEEPSTRIKLRGTALTAAAAVGGDLLDPVLRIVRDDTDGLAGVALHCLRKARGDDAAEKVATLLATTDDTNVRREVAVVLGETRSFKATPHLIELLDSEDQNTRHAAARGLSLVRDPAAIKTLLTRLEPAVDDFPLARNIVDALGTIGATEALPKLRALRESEDPRWASVRPYIRRAISRIEDGNPDSTRMD